MLELRHVIDQTGFDMVDYAKIESEGIRNKWLI